MSGEVSGDLATPRVGDVVAERDLDGGVGTHLDGLAVHDVGRAVGAGRDVDERHRRGAVGVLDDVGDDAGLRSQLDAQLATLWHDAVTDELRDLQTRLVAVEVTVVGERVDEDGGLARLGDAPCRRPRSAGC